MSRYPRLAPASSDFWGIVATRRRCYARAMDDPQFPPDPDPDDLPTIDDAPEVPPIEVESHDDADALGMEP